MSVRRSGAEVKSMAKSDAARKIARRATMKDALKALGPTVTVSTELVLRAAGALEAAIDYPEHLAEPGILLDQDDLISLFDANENTLGLALSNLIEGLFPDLDPDDPRAFDSDPRVATADDAYFACAREFDVELDAAFKPPLKSQKTLQALADGVDRYPRDEDHRLVEERIAA